MTSEQSDIVGRMIAFENGELSNGEALELFGELVKTGMAWELQGAYGRTAGDLIGRGFLTEEGDIVVANPDE
jgi:hypothetical protein